MKILNSLRLVLFGMVALACQGQSNPKAKEPVAKQEVNRTEEEWKKILTPEQFYILREKGTDRAFTGQYYKHSEKGVYSCAACGTALFTSDMKFDSDCGWPSFDKELAGGKIKKIEDRSFGMLRTEIVCANCGSHLGHLFDDGPTVTGQRYCVNSTSIGFKKEE